MRKYAPFLSCLLWSFVPIFLVKCASVIVYLWMEGAVGALSRGRNTGDTTTFFTHTSRSPGSPGSALFVCAYGCLGKCGTLRSGGQRVDIIGESGIRPGREGI